jgi:hypothetical protein
VAVLRWPLLTVCRLSALVVLFGALSGAFAQSRPVEPAQSDRAISGQNQITAPDQAQASQAQASTVAEPNQPQGLIHIVPFGRGSGAVKTASAPAGAHLTYFGGPVISNISVVVVFWGPNVNPAVTANGTIDQFYTDITTSRFYDLLTEYSTVGVTGTGGASSNQSLGRGTFGGKFTIIPTLCAGLGPCTLTDAQIQTELTKQLNTAVLPPPTHDAQGIINTYYAIYFPPGVSINDGTSLSCVKGGFCAYHSNTGSLVPYGVVPDFEPPSGCALGCGQGSAFQNITAVSSHEMSETTTDAQAGSASVFGPPLAWYDHVPAPGTDLGEIGDICGGQDTIVTAGGNSYSVQQEFSNLQNDCVTQPPTFNLNAPGAAPGVPFNLPLTIQSSVNSSTLAGYTGTVHFTSSDVQAILPADYTFVSGDAGTHTFSVTLKGLGSQTITVTDTHSLGFTGTATVTVNSTPGVDLSTTISVPAAPFFQGEVGATFLINVQNVGDTASSGPVTLADALPAGLTATAMSGPGWNCTLGSLTCTRSDSLVANSVYPTITLAFKIAANAPASVTETATVSGGGDGNASNNTSTAITPIVPAIAIIANTGANTVNAGQAAVFSFLVNAQPTAGTITFTCSGLPTASTCSFNPPSTTAVTTQLAMTITTTARGSTWAPPQRGPGDGGRRLLLLGLILSLLTSVLFGYTRPRGRLRRLAPGLSMAAFLLCGVLAGCGGGGSTPPPPPPPVVGTPAGTYAITITGTSASNSATSVVTLLVQ